MISLYEFLVNKHINISGKFQEIASNYLKSETLIKKLDILLNSIYNDAWSNEIHDLESLQGMWENIEDAKEDKGISNDLELYADANDTAYDIYYKIYDYLKGSRNQKQEILSEIGYAWLEEKVK